jgi:hypothetical protein
VALVNSLIQNSFQVVAGFAQNRPVAPSIPQGRRVRLNPVMNGVFGQQLRQKRVTLGKKT